MRLNKQIFHDFFYDNLGDNNRAGRAKSATSYRGNHFFSYSTEIGCIINQGARPVLLLSDYRFSNTTAAHISALQAACPFRDIIYVPFDLGDGFFDLEYMFKTLRDRFIARLEGFTPADVKRAQPRRELIHLYENYAAFHVAAGFTAEDCAGLHNIVELAELAREIEDATAAERAELLKKHKARAIAAALKIEKELETLAIADIARSIWSNKGALRGAALKARRDYLQNKYGNGHASFIWREGAFIETSQGVTFEVAAAKKIYQLFKAGKITENMHVGPYTILKIAPDHIQIGCHWIPRENLDQVCAAL